MLCSCCRVVHWIQFECEHFKVSYRAASLPSESRSLGSGVTAPRQLRAEPRPIRPPIEGCDRPRTEEHRTRSSEQRGGVGGTRRGQAPALPRSPPFDHPAAAKDRGRLSSAGTFSRRDVGRRLCRAAKAAARRRTGAERAGVSHVVTGRAAAVAAWLMREHGWEGETELKKGLPRPPPRPPLPRLPEGRGRRARLGIYS